MRELNVLRMAPVLGAAATLLICMAPGAWAQEAFDACTVFTQEEAEQVLGAPATGEPVNPNPKVKRPKVVTACTYSGAKDGKEVAASVQFRFGKTEADAKSAFEDARMQFQTKPLLITGMDSVFWSNKTGQMNVRKGRTWVTLSVGPARLSERDMSEARKLAEILAKKL